MADEFKMEVLYKPIIYIRIDGMDYPFYAVLGVVQEFEGTFPWTAEINDDLGKLEEVLIKRGIIKKTTRGGTVVADENKRKEFENKLKRSLHVYRMPERRAFEEKMLKEGFTKKRPTRKGIYLSAHYDGRQEPSETAIIRRNGKMMAKRPGQTDTWLCEMSHYDKDWLWKRIGDYNAE